jgi:hypothetical protein
MQLDPCKHCGGDAMWNPKEIATGKYDDDFGFIDCTVCGVRTEGRTTRAVAIAAWNRRAYLDRSSSNETVAVKVKQLEWIKRSGPDGIWDAYTPLGPYRLDDAFQMQHSGGLKLILPQWRSPFHSAGEQCTSLDAGKAAAQADYATRIRSALEPSPAQPPLLSEAEWQLRAELRSDWEHFCQCDWHLMQGDTATFDQRMEAAGFIDLVPVTDSALEMPFASELGIEKGGMMWQLTPLGSSIVKTSKGAPNV